jgi:hypothetical protein
MADGDRLPTLDEWRDLLAQQPTEPEQSIDATWIRDFQARDPQRTLGKVRQVMARSEGRTSIYYVKPTKPYAEARTYQERERVRCAVHEQVTGRLGILIDAPVPQPVFIRVTPATIPAKAMRIGIHHGTPEIPNLRSPVKYQRRWPSTAPDLNRPRFARLAVLYGWVFCAFDHQFAFEDSGDELVWAYDHGLTIGRGKQWDPTMKRWAADATWDEAELNGRPKATLDPVIAASVPLGQNDVREALGPLATIEPTQIARIIAAVPSDWWASDDDRAILAHYLERRRRELLSSVPA